MRPAEAKEALIERSAAAAGVTRGAAVVECDENVEVVVRRLMQGLLDHDEIAEVLPLLEGGAVNAAHAVLAGPETTAGFIAQMVTFGLLLGKGRS
jgi:DNA-binding SARP family transcriptional activator